ncbi:MAG: hypothetical protein H6Q71_1696 [Firmicutes bacterium]|nr:hypothetical protein [Bacillota bacterium]
MSVNQTIDASKMLGALELANPVTITSDSGVLTLTADSNCFIADGSEAITSITGVDQGIYIITWNTVRTLTYNASALVLVGQANKTTAVGDVGVYQINSGVVTELLYQPVSGKASSAAKADTSTTAESCTGNAATATQLATARTIALTGDVTGSGTFDGSSDLSIATTGVEAAKLTTARTIAITGNAAGSATFDGSADVSITVDVTNADTATTCTGNAATATKLATARTLSFTGDATGSLSFDGSADESAALTLASSGVTAGTYKSVTVDAKGRVTAGTNPTTLNGYGITDALPLSGGTMSGAIAMGSNKITGLADGTTSGNAVHYGQFGASIGTNGYQKLPSGLIIQWGTVSITIDTNSDDSWYWADKTVTLPITFPTACLCATATGCSAYGGMQFAAIESFTTSQVVVQADSTRSNTTFPVYWMAIGY